MKGGIHMEKIKIIFIYFVIVSCLVSIGYGSFYIVKSIPDLIYPNVKPFSPKEFALSQGKRYEKIFSDVAYQRDDDMLVLADEYDRDAYELNQLRADILIIKELNEMIRITKTTNFKTEYKDYLKNIDKIKRKDALRVITNNLGFVVFPVILITIMRRKKYY